MKRLRHLFTLFLIMGLMVGCSRKEQGKQARVLHLDNKSEVDTLDPALIRDVAASRVVMQLFEGLLEYHPKTLEPIPGAASHYDVSEDGKVYTFHLRKEAKWSNGDPVTAHDFVYSWKRVVDPKLGAAYAFQAFYIKNAQKIYEGKANASELGVTAVDDLTLRVELENPTPFFSAIVTFQTLRPVHQKTVEAYGDKWIRAEHIVSNGAFILKEWTPNKQIVLEPNPKYWDRKNLKLDRVVYYPLEDREVAFKLFRAGQLHYVDEVPSLKIPTLQGDPEFNHGPFLGAYYVLVNVAKPPFNNKHLRQALAMSIDREKITQVLHRGIANAAFTPKGTAGYQPPEGLPFNPEKARALLAEAGYPEGKGLPKITLSYNTDQDHKRVMELVQNMWKENLGIEVEIRNMEWKTLYQSYRERNYELGRMGWIGDYVDPNTFLDMHLTGNGNNDAGWSNLEYDRLIRLAGETINSKKRFEYFQKAESILLDESPVLPIYTWTFPSMMSKKMEGYHHTLLGMHPLKFVSLKE
ncbi:MAG: hypothetical protein A3I05_00525 [Deltaproteobacteria bacterium RIFCSPLOWO2_02_FULL_44_10]|nr:MAG: hypothetical protein A3C46_01395 [Deltaproteobacteria bacterium RIFCSPHIGHO2_02_FULL_44_16]OGQ47288.1 MAG: hypothetical protein A3I05_00525 [Deltaproteobacteria bacterium RIFCSPLOWO2_02_FULL_44_10]